MLRTEGLQYAVDGRTLLKETHLEFASGRFHVIMGANGAGKSTLVKLLAGELQPTSGRVWLNERELKHYSHLQLARRRAVLSQHYAISFPVAVEELVLMGRYPHFGARPSESDRNICTEAMELMKVNEFAGREYGTLSGGEAQKVQMSRVLAQIWGVSDSLLFLDEPVSHLDVRFQYELLRIARERAQQGATVIAILHDLNLALTFADRLLLMHQGRVLFDLPDPSQVDAMMLEAVFGILPTIIRRDGGKPLVVFGG